MQVHLLKTWPEYWDAVADGLKPFEIRKDDRGYAVGDVLVLRQYDPTTQAFLQYAIVVAVSYRTEPGCPFLPPGFVAMGLRKPTHAEVAAAVARATEEHAWT